MLTPKTSFFRLKEYIICEKLFYGGNLSFCRENLLEIPVFIRWKRPFRNKNTSVNTENEVFSSKRVHLCEKLFYGGNLSFCREKLVEIPVFIRWKRPFRNKKYKC